MKDLIKNFLVKIYLSAKNLHQNNVYTIYRMKYGIPSSFRFNGDDIKIYGEGKLTIGNNSYIGSLSTLQLDDLATIEIGSNCRISHNVRMYTSSSKADQDFNIYNKLEKNIGSILIGNAVWIGVNVFIGPGIKIGNNVIIGANSVITRDIPNNAIVGGVPAKVIRYKNISA